MEKTIKILSQNKSVLTEDIECLDSPRTYFKRKRGMKEHYEVIYLSKDARRGDKAFRTSMKRIRAKNIKTPEWGFDVYKNHIIS